MMDPLKRCLVNLLSALTRDDDVESRTTSLTNAIRESRKAIGLIPLSNEDVVAHLLTTSAEIMGDHAHAQGLHAFSMDLVDTKAEQKGPFIIVSLDEDMTAALNDLIGDDDEMSLDGDDTDEDEAVVNVVAPDKNWEN